MQTHAFCKDIKVVLLMAGQGTRWNPLSSVLPKPCIPFLNYPFVDFILAYLKHWSIKEVYCNMFHLPLVILNNLEKHANSFHFHISHELNLLGTAGGIRKIFQLYGESTSLVINADIFCPVSISSLFSYYKRKNAEIILCIKPLLSKLSYTALYMDKNGRVFLNKNKDCIDNKYYYIGTSLLEPCILSNIQSGSYGDLAKDVFFNQVANVASIGYKIRSYWIDIGTPQTYLESTAVFMKRIKRGIGIKWLPEDFQKKQVMECKKNSISLFHRNAKIGSDLLEGFVVAGHKTFIGHDVYIRNSVLMQDSVVEAGAKLTHCIVGPSTIVKTHSSYKNKLILSRILLNAKDIPSTQQDDQNVLIAI